MAGSGVNKVILVGNLGKDPEVRYTPGGQAVANFTIATNEAWTGKDGQKQYTTEVVANPVGGVVFLGGGAGGGRGAGRQGGAPAEDFGSPPPGLDEAPSGGGAPKSGGDDDIPF